MKCDDALTELRRVHDRRARERSLQRQAGAGAALVITSSSDQLGAFGRVIDPVQRACRARPLSRGVTCGRRDVVALLMACQWFDQARQRARRIGGIGVVPRERLWICSRRP